MFFELSKPEHTKLVAESHSIAETLLKARETSRDPRFLGLDVNELAIEIAVRDISPFAKIIPDMVLQ